MPESFAHRMLADRIVEYVSKRFAHVGALVLLADKPGRRDEPPPRIGGFVPDVYAADVPTTFTVLGEAKTGKDLFTPRSSRQIAAFLRFLAISPHGVFVLSVPWEASASARAVVASGMNGLAPESVEIVLLDGVARPTQEGTVISC